MGTPVDPAPRSVRENHADPQPQASHFAGADFITMRFGGDSATKRSCSTASRFTFNPLRRIGGGGIIVRPARSARFALRAFGIALSRWQSNGVLIPTTFFLIRFAESEGVGFEPTEPFGSPVFKTGAIDHSTTPPE